jgi:hypothetical protein
VVLASGQSYATSIASDANNIYWANFKSPFAIMSVPKSGGAAATAIVTGTNVAQPYNIASDGVRVFWTNGVGAGTAYQATTAGVNQTELGTTNASFGMAVGGGYVVWTNRSGPTEVTQVKVTTGVATAAATQPGSTGSANGVATDGAMIYWADSGYGTIYRTQVGAVGCALPNGCTAVSAATNPYAVAVDANNVYWSELAGSYGIFMAPKGGGPASRLAYTVGNAQSLASDGTKVYWGDFGDNSVRMVAVNASAPCTTSGATACAIVPQSQTLGYFPDGVAVDATAVYWTDQIEVAGGVMKWAK